MTRIDFYILEPATDSTSNYEQAAEIFICRLTEKAWLQNNAVYIHALDEQHANKLDELMWVFNPASFIPHQLPPFSANENTVLIGHSSTTETPVNHHDVLINLNHESPSFFSQFERVAEIITADETSRIKGRERYQFYRDRGYALETHKLSL